MSNKISMSIDNGIYNLSISMENKGYPEAMLQDLISRMLLSAKNAADDVRLNNNDRVPVCTEPVPVIRETTVQTKQEERPTFRKRLPNNVVDVKDLSIKQAVTEQALVRCPHCGQSHVLAVHSNNHVYMMRKFYSVIMSTDKNASTDEFRIIAEFDSLNNTELINMCCKEDTDRKAYWEDIQSIKMIDDKDFAVDNDTEIFCPVCCTSDKFEEWKNAYQNPLDYFETEHLCDACGGEKLEQVVKGTKYHECDKCGLRTTIQEG